MHLRLLDMHGSDRRDHSFAKPVSKELQVVLGLLIYSEFTVSLEILIVSVIYA